MKLYIVSIRRPIGNAGQWIDKLLPARREKTRGFKKEEDRLRSLYAGLLLQKIYGIADESRILYNQYGKPFTENGPEFSLSHGGDYVILGIDERPVGVDVEPIREFDPAVAQETLQPDELNWVLDKDRDARLYAMWTRKESIMKAAGKGFSLPPASFSVLPADAAMLSVDGADYGIHTCVYANHSISVAVLGMPVDCELVSVSPTDLLADL